MPLYDFKCKNKECKTKMYETLIDHNIISQGSHCPDCGQKATRVYAPTKHKFDFKYGYDAGLGKYFDSAQARDNFVGANDLRRMKD